MFCHTLFIAILLSYLPPVDEILWQISKTVTTMPGSLRIATRELAVIFDCFVAILPLLSRPELQTRAFSYGLELWKFTLTKIQTLGQSTAKAQHVDIFSAVLDTIGAFVVTSVSGWDFL